jgi:hypothetical protein
MGTGRTGYDANVGDAPKIVTAEDMDKMTPQQRADVIDAGLIRSWHDVDPEFKKRVLARVPEVAARLATDD